MLIDCTDDIVPRPRHGLRTPTLEEMRETATMRDYYTGCTVEPEKICVQCGDSYPATTEYWHRHPSTRDRLDIRCKECKKLIWLKTLDQCISDLKDTMEAEQVRKEKP